jgi:hypothetical protein
VKQASLRKVGYIEAHPGISLPAGLHERLSGEVVLGMAEASLTPTEVDLPVVIVPAADGPAPVTLAEAVNAANAAGAKKSKAAASPAGDAPTS